MASNKRKVASAILTIGSAMAWEKLTRMKPSSPPAIPPDFDSITAQWLTGALCSAVPGARVESFASEGGSRGTTSRVMLKITYNEAGQQAGLPGKVFIKGATSFTQRITGILSEAVQLESRFFSEIRKELDIEATEAYFSGYELPSQRAMVILKPMEDCTYTNPKLYITRKNAEDMIGVLATVHGTFWDSPRFPGNLSWLKSAHDYQAMLNDLGFEERCDVGTERAASVFAPELYRRKAEVFPCLWKSHELAGKGIQTLLHNDVHIGNWYRTADDRMGLCDWQGIIRGNFGSDLAYAISSALTVEDRRAWEQDLIRLYVEKLRANGVANPPDFNQAWLCYRQQFFHALVFWTFTIGQGPLQADMQPDDYSLINLERMTTAMADLESLDSF